MSDGAGPPASVLKRAGFFLVVGAILFVLFDQFGPYQSGRGYRPGGQAGQLRDGRRR